MISIGYKNYIAIDKILTIIEPDSRPVKLMVQAARERNMLVDATLGKKTKSVIVTTSNHVVLSANLPDTIIERLHQKQLREQGDSL
ncbi:DUF370 domain-containing protein [candidate division KSB1 bacterium]|nr:DUF370 domain-containing protein [candidate division KSB1 bacterium]